MFADILKAPAVQSLARQLEHGGALPCPGVSPAAQPFFAALLQKLFPQRLLVVVTENLKTQESFQQDLETWRSAAPLFYPPWEIFPHEGKLPHADVISDRLQTLIARDVAVTPNTYRLTFDTHAWSRRNHVDCFFPEVQIVFDVKDSSQHYHVPLLISPYGYSTYRGS